MNNIKIEIKWAVIFIVMMIIWMFIERISGLHDVNIAYHAIFTNFVAIPAIIIYVLALKDKRNNFYGGVMTYGQGFKCGIIISLIIAIFSPVLQLLISNVISPDYFKNAIEYAVQTGVQTREEAEKYFNLQSYMIMSAIGSFVMGTITTAIVAIFMKKK
ncbi:MAG TPA: DUF4199 domain-containing protein [Bacteroidetes bacterium]|nr:DUF4199 domain-containing protein [Ignavibacteria bacterium]HCA41631.1 DUF4199 domain-containing protein [Bacteroidota bacterium]HCN37377.1 DUF4199 domain-containing protein [Bacteroidota bacterium]